MYKVNLADKMIAGKKRVLSADLAVKEANDLLQSLGDRDVQLLDRLGMTGNIDAAKKEKALSARLAVYDQTKVFHIDEIKSICNKYFLRFLPSENYIGTIDPLLPSKVFEYESIHGRDDRYYICAPASSFKLQARPKDPLFFARIGNTEHYYLIHKWGNDLSISRRVNGLFSNLLFIILFSIASVAVLSFISLPLGGTGFLIWDAYFLFYGIHTDRFSSRRWRREFN